MKVKKFSCYNCGAPKVNPYKSPYVLCDFCGSLCDIDYTMGYDAWYADPKRTSRYQKAEKKILDDLAICQQTKNKKEYYQLQEVYWDLYYKTYPEYLPPTIVPDTAVYREYLFICADYSTTAAFDPGQSYVSQALQQNQRWIAYETIDGTSKAKSEGFFRYMEYYIDYLKDSMKSFYETPEYALMHQVLPQPVHLKIKFSSLAQIWLPYLTERDAKRFLERLGFSSDYTNVPILPFSERPCHYCQKPLAVPEGAVRVHCEACHKTNLIQDQFSCTSCGTANAVPELPVNTINCVSCGTENRLIKRLFD